MSKKNIITLAVTFLVVAGFYLYLFSDSFRKPVIQISHTIRPKAWAFTHPTPNSAESDAINAITFRLEHSYKLTSLKVIAVPELETNKFAHPVWELDTDSNSMPVQAFSYGGRIRGMHPPVKGQTATPLTPNVEYRLFVEAGPLKGEHDFTVTEASRLAQ
jgi:hypothetical protein